MSTLLVDANNVLMRALYAMNMSVLTANGRITSPTLVFINSLAGFIRAEKPDRVLVCWDAGSNRRLALDPTYKAHRSPPSPKNDQMRADSFFLCSEFCALAGVPQQRVLGLEADDLIAGAWSTLTLAQTDQIVIASSDKDFLQLLGANPYGVPTEQIRLSSRDTPTDRWTAERLQEQEGLTPAQWPLMTALTGDSADGVKGVPGIGKVKAKRILADNGWNLDATTQAILQLKGEEVARRIVVDYQLVDLRTNQFPVGVPRFQPTRKGDAVWPFLDEFLEDYQLSTVQSRLVAGLLWEAPREPVTSGGRGGWPPNE